MIPSVFIGKSDAEKILDHYTYKVRNSHLRWKSKKIIHRLGYRFSIDF